MRWRRWLRRLRAGLWGGFPFYKTMRQIHAWPEIDRERVPHGS